MSGASTVLAGELGYFKGGSGFPVRYQGAKTGQLPFFKVSDMNNPGNELFMRHANNYISEKQRKRLGATRIPAGAIVFAKVGAAVYLERKRILTQDSCIDNNMAAFVVDPKRLDLRLAHYLLTGFRLSSLVATTALPSLNGGQLRSIPLRVPDDLKEQRSIVDSLADVDSLISALERKVAKKQAIKQGMMQQLLTGQARLPGFTKPWVGVTLGDLGIFLKGRGIKRNDVRSSGVPCIRYGELYTTFANYTSFTRSFVSSLVAATALPIRTGDLLFAGSGETKEEIGMCVAYVGKRGAVAGGDIIVLRGSVFNAVYLATLMNSPALARQKARFGQGDAVVHISSRALAGVEFTFPERDEQDAIATALMDADREIEHLRHRLAKACDVKQGMLQQLLTGRTRLPVSAEVSS